MDRVPALQIPATAIIWQRRDCLATAVAITPLIRTQIITGFGQGANIDAAAHYALVVGGLVPQGAVLLRQISPHEAVLQVPHVIAKFPTQLKPIISIINRLASQPLANLPKKPGTLG